MKHFKHYVYALQYPDGSIFYIGKASNLSRITSHEREAKKGIMNNPYKISTIRKIWDEGNEVVRTKLAFFETDEESMQYEIALIFFLPNLTNLTSGGDGLAGLVFSEDHKEKLRVLNTGKVMSVEARKKMAQARLGKKASPELKRRLSDIQRGRKHTSEAKAKIKIANTGRKQTAEAIAARVESFKRNKPFRDAANANSVRNSGNVYPPIISPEGVVYRDITNMRAFARSQEEKLNSTCLTMLANGQRKSYRGWRVLVEDSTLTV